MVSGARSTFIQKVQDLPVGIDAPLKTRRFYGRNPFLGESEVSCPPKIPSITFARSRFDVKPNVLNNDIIHGENVENFVDLGLDRLASHTGRLSARTWRSQSRTYTMTRDLHGKTYASIFVKPAATAASYVATKFLSTLPP